MTGVQTCALPILILDLRDNHGGYLLEATNILDEFVDGRKVLVFTEIGRASCRERV